MVTSVDEEEVHHRSLYLESRPSMRDRLRGIKKQEPIEDSFQAREDHGADNRKTMPTKTDLGNLNVLIIRQ